MRSSTSSFKFQHLLFSLKSPSSCLCLFCPLPVTSILLSIFPLITCLEGSSCARCDRFNSTSFVLLHVGYSSLPLLYVILHYCTISTTDLLHTSPVPHFKTSKLFLIYFLKCPSFSTIQSYAPNVAFY